MPMNGMMKAFVASAARVTVALLVIAAVVTVGLVGWLARQDHAYASGLRTAQQSADKVSDPEIQARLTEAPTFLCEKRAGVPVSAVLVRLVHWADTESIAAATRSVSELNGVDPPERWKDFHFQVLERRQLMVEWSIAIDAANSRALELVTTRTVDDDLDVVTLLATDRKYRELADTAAALRSDVLDAERRLRKAAPDHYLRDKAIDRELRRTETPGTLDVGRMYLNATRPRTAVSMPKGPDAETGALPTPEGSSSASPGVTDPAAAPAVAGAVSPGGYPPPPPQSPSAASGERCVNGKTIVD